MGENTAIEWAHHTFNPWIGCTKVSPACDLCYAETQNAFYGWNKAGWGAHASRRRTSFSNWQKPLKWDRDARANGVRERVFCASLADVFDNHRSITSGWHGDLWSLISRTPNLDWLLLTKRPQNFEKMLPESYGMPAWNEGWQNVWIGVSAENQTEWNRRVPILKSIPAQIRFVSSEPLLSKIDCGDLSGIHQIITGGENGRNFRATDDDWLRSIRDQCAGQKVAFLHKQYGGANRAAIKAKGRMLDGVIHDGYPQAVA
jgi:protein gp37